MIDNIEKLDIGSKYTVHHIFDQYYKGTRTLILNSFHYEIYEAKKSESGLHIKCKSKGQEYQHTTHIINSFGITVDWDKNTKINCEHLRGLSFYEILKTKMQEIGIEENDFLYLQ